MSEKHSPENTGLSSELAYDNKNADLMEQDTLSSTLDQIVESVKELTPPQKRNDFLFRRTRDYDVPDSEATVTLTQFDLFYPNSPNAQKIWERELKDSLGLVEIIIYDPRIQGGRQETYKLRDDDGHKVLARTKPTSKEGVDFTLIEFLGESEAVQLLELLRVLQDVNK